MDKEGIDGNLTSLACQWIRLQVYVICTRFQDFIIFISRTNDLAAIFVLASHVVTGSGKQIDSSRLVAS
jgi:hypothetical protein